MIWFYTRRNAVLSAYNNNNNNNIIISNIYTHTSVVIALL